MRGIREKSRGGRARSASRAAVVRGGWWGGGGCALSGHGGVEEAVEGGDALEDLREDSVQAGVSAPVGQEGARAGAGGTGDDVGCCADALGHATVGQGGGRTETPVFTMRRMLPRAGRPSRNCLTLAMSIPACGGEARHVFLASTDPKLFLADVTIGICISRAHSASKRVDPIAPKSSAG